MKTTPRHTRPRPPKITLSNGKTYPSVNAMLRGIAPKTADTTIDRMIDQMADENLRLAVQLFNLVNACTPMRLPGDRGYPGVQAPEKAKLEEARSVLVATDWLPEEEEEDSP